MQIIVPSKTPLLDRRGGLWRGAEGDETEAGVVDFLNLIPPPRILWLKTSFFNNYAANL